MIQKKTKKVIRKKNHESYLKSALNLMRNYYKKSYSNPDIKPKNTRKRKRKFT